MDATILETLNGIDSMIISSSLMVGISILVKGPLGRLFTGLVFYFGKTFNNDDIVRVDGERARISKIGMSNTHFQIIDNDSDVIRIRVVPNHRISYLKLEKEIRCKEEN